MVTRKQLNKMNNVQVLLLMDENKIDIDYKKMIVLKENKPIYRIIERHSNTTHKMLIPKLEVIGGVEND